MFTLYSLRRTWITVSWLKSTALPGTNIPLWNPSTTLFPRAWQPQVPCEPGKSNQLVMENKILFYYYHLDRWQWQKLQRCQTSHKHICCLWLACWSVVVSGLFTDWLTWCWMFLHVVHKHAGYRSNSTYIQPGDLNIIISYGLLHNIKIKIKKYLLPLEKSKLLVISADKFFIVYYTLRPAKIWLLNFSFIIERRHEK